MADAKIINYGQPIGAGSTAIPDNTSTALDIESTDAKDYITIDTTDNEEKIVLTHKTVITDKGGASGNIGQIDTSNGRKADALVIDTADDGGMTILGAGNDPMTFNFVSGAIGDRSFINAKAGTSDANQYLALGAGAVEGLRVQTSGSQTVTQFGQDNYDPQIEQSSGGNMGYTFKGDTNTGMTSGGGSDTLYLTAGSTQAIYIAESGAIATTQINGPVSTVGAFATQGSGTVGTGGSSSTTLEQASASTFQTELHVGAAIKIISGGVIKKATVASITDANTLELDSAETIADGSNWYFDSGELFAVKTGDSKTLFSVQPTGAIGAGANAGTTTGVYNNLGIGDPTMFDKLTTGNALFVMGNQSGDYDFTTANALIAIGYNACAASTTSQNLVAIGTYAADTNTNIRESVIIGGGAGRSSGNDSVHIGHGTGASATGANSVFVGRQAGENCTGSESVAVGSYALDGSADSDQCVAIGHLSMSSTNSASADGNVGVGYASMFSCTSGSNNTALGRNVAGGITTAQNCVVIGKDANVSAADVDNEIVIGKGGAGNGSNTVTLGNGSITALHCEVQSISALSDSRIKDNVEESSLGLDFINALRPVKYQKKHPSEYPEEIRSAEYSEQVLTRTRTDEDGNNVEYTETIEAETKPEGWQPTAEYGLIAQEVKAVMESQNATDWQGHKVLPNGAHSLGYGYLVPVLVKAVQELTARVAELEAGD